MVVGTPRFGRIVGPVSSDGLITALVGLLAGDGTGCRPIHQHLPPGCAHLTEEVEVLDAEEEVGVGQNAGVDHTARYQGGSPTGHVHGNEFGGGRHHVDGVGTTTHEAPAVGDDGTDRRMGS